MRKLYVAFLLLFSILYWAQVPIIEVPNQNGKFEKNETVVLQKLNIETKITGGISTNVITMVFKNNSNRLMSGRLTFPLPEGINVSGYALDINGKLRNAVPVEKEKAKEIFETIKKRNVDPGILEKVEGNSFRTIIYTITANGGERTVQITYHYELKKNGNQYEYFLPLNYSAAIPEFGIRTSVFQNTVSPKLEERPDGSFNFVKNGNVWIAETHKTNYKPGQNLKITFPQNDEVQNILTQKASDDSSYFLAGLGIDSKERAKKLPNRLAIVWDSSLSGLKRDHNKEWALLEEYFKINKDLSVKVYFLSNTFDEGKSFTINNGNWSLLKNYLTQTIYDGGTDLGQLKNVKEDEVLFFTDGLSSFGDLNLTEKKPVYTIASSNSVNFSQLKFISNKTGGAFLNLNENAPGKEVRKLLYQPLKFLKIENNPSLTEVYPSIPQSIGQDFVLTGIIKGNQAMVKVLFGYGNEVTETKMVSLDTNKQAVEDWEISQFWAQKKLNELEIFEKENRDEIKDISKQFGLVSNNMSLMVLENVADYVRYTIVPPVELREEYNMIVKNNRNGREQRINDLVQQAEKMTDNLKTWWNIDFQDKKNRYPKPIKKMNSGSTVVTSTLNNVVSDAAPIAVRAVASVTVNQALQGRVQGVQVSERRNSDSTLRKDIEEVVVTAMGIRPGKIKTIDLKSDAAYMKFFDNATKAEQIYQIYLAHRTDYLETPQYYFDVAQLLYKNNDKVLGLKVLSAIADLDLENEELYKLLAYKLKQAEIYDKELWITKKVLEWRPFDPQSYRDYALALEDNKQYQGALDNLYKVLTQSYTRELADRDNGIEEIIIMEINQLISNYGSKLDLKNINPKLIADLPVNIRVVINWNKDDTDIDLWVTDPNKERCMYSHKETEIGGRLSDDFTSGFGPEQFLLKKAIKGKYQIQTNFFGENQVGIAGPTAIMAEVYINYATGKQERKTVVFQNKKKSTTGRDEGILIGEFEF